MTSTTVWPKGIIQVKVPLPFSLKWVNSYLLRDEKGYTLIDPGLHTPESIETWNAALAEHDIVIQDIHTIVLTHQHPDHYGLAGWFQQRTGAPVLISPRSYAYIVKMWGKDRSYAAELVALYRQHGMPEHLLDAMPPHLESFMDKVSPQPEVTFIEAGGVLRMAGMDWQMIDAPGHASGQLCFYAPERKWMICGDQVLPNITPNVSVVPGDEGGELEQFLGSLKQLGAYEVELAFPGHRDPFTGFGLRIEELIDHHKRRLESIAERVKEEGCTGYAMCERLFGARIAGNPHNLRFAMSETLAHLFHLEQRNEISSSIRDGVIVYQA
ncbi:MBL fold metallo-hydrolase [Paenibacillus oenotherae]|uniref:MBL fold metallo-hydrolase n=2 Tax=Paenibacillus oenotherae TaxID=1435645 RepID=A0ABS7DAN9_9BACL|nr:MBL fold metallo-hydrolase [Paenibacillus oenotherae]